MVDGKIRGTGDWDEGEGLVLGTGYWSWGWHWGLVTGEKVSGLGREEGRGNELALATTRVDASEDGGGAERAAG